MESPHRREARTLTREDLNGSVRVSARLDNQRHGDNLVELYEDRPHPRSKAFTRNTRDRAYRSPGPTNERANLRQERDISPWSSSSVDGDDDDDDDDDALSISSRDNQEIPAARASLLTESPADSRKIRLLQEWIRDYDTIVSEMRALYDSAAGRTAGDRSYEDDRIQGIMINAARVQLGPRSMVDRSSWGMDIRDVTDGISPAGFEGRFRQPVVRARADNEIMYVPDSYGGRQSQADHSRGRGDDSLAISRTAQYGDSRQPNR